MANLRRQDATGFRWLRLALIALMTALLCGVGMPTIKVLASSTPYLDAQVSSDLLQQARRVYTQGRYAQAVSLWQQIAQDYESQQDSLNQAMALNNLTLAYLKLGQYDNATQLIDSSFSLLDPDSSEEYHQRILAQSFAVKGQLQLGQNKTEQALESFSQAGQYYKAIDDRTGVVRSQLNQAEILRVQGRYRQALTLVTEINDALQAEPDSKLKVLSLQKLGNLMRLVADPLEAEQVLQQSFDLAEQLGLANSRAMALVHLGNAADTRQETEKAVDYYKQAAAVDASTTTRLQALINAFNILVRQEETEQAQRLIPEIRRLLAELPPSRLAIYSQINFVQTLLTTEPTLLPMDDVAELAVSAIAQAKQIGDLQAESYALGNLGAVYEHTQQPDEAIKLTQRALALAQATNAGHILYQWQWQLGRLYEANGQRQDAIEVYGDAIATLQSLRQDLVSVNPEVRFSFREGVEPIYRQLVSLLLDTPAEGATEEGNLLQARNVIESLQLEELVNFFRADCVVENPVQIDQVDQQAAVIYPIILADRLEVVLSLPGQSIKHFSTGIPKTEIDDTIVSLLNEIFLSPGIFTSSRSRFATSEEAWSSDVLSSPRPQVGLFLPHAQRLYSWIIKPLEADLAAAETRTLVFVLDGKLRNLPMAVLHDGSQYLVEKYGIALTPGLQLLEPQPLRQGSLQTIVAGLSESRQGFTPLPGVAREIEAIQQQVRSRVLFNETFLGETFRGAIDETAFPVVHLATHGQFSSDPDETFILTWDDRINVNELSSLLQTSEISREQPIELLILSACETATGDDRAALGLAGVAVRSGARSTLATLWPVDDFSTAEFMSQLYGDLASLQRSKAEILRQAQLRLLYSEEYNHPFFWAPFVLVGNWL